jgi:hypothetical protein
VLAEYAAMKGNRWLQGAASANDLRQTDHVRNRVTWNWGEQGLKWNSEFVEFHLCCKNQNFGMETSNAMIV